MKKFIVCFLLLSGIAHGTPAMIAKQRREAEERARLERIAREEAERRKEEEARRQRIEAVAAEVSVNLDTHSSPPRGRVHSAESTGSDTDLSEASTVSVAPSAEESLRSAASAATRELGTLRLGVVGERCPSAAEVIDGLQVMTDGTKNYTRDRTTLTDGKQLDLQSKFNRIFAVTADSLADIVWNEFFPIIQRTTLGRFRVASQPIAFPERGEDPIAAGGMDVSVEFLDFMKKFLNRGSWVARQVQPKPEVAGRRYVAFGIGLLVCSMIKPEEAATITSKTLLKKHIQRQLWLMDLLKIMRIMDQGLLIESYETLRESTTTLPNLVSGETVNGEAEEGNYRTPTIDLKRALKVLNRLPEAALRAR